MTANWHSIRTLVALGLLLQSVASSADCLNDQMMCSQRCILSNIKDTMCVSRCGDQARTCLQRERDRQEAERQRKDERDRQESERARRSNDDTDTDSKSSNGSQRSAATADSAEIPDGSYASWTESDKKQAARALKAMCSQECDRYIRAAQQGVGQRASYEAAACTLACYVNNLPDDYPRIEEYKRDAIENYNNAKRLGSSVPYFLGQ